MKDTTTEQLHVLARIREVVEAKPGRAMQDELVEQIRRDYRALSTLPVDRNGRRVGVGMRVKQSGSEDVLEVIGLGRDFVELPYNSTDSWRCRFADFARDFELVDEEDKG